jgi:hypothetical protein
MMDIPNSLANTVRGWNSQTSKHLCVRYPWSRQLCCSMVQGTTSLVSPRTGAVGRRRDTTHRHRWRSAA